MTKPPYTAYVLSEETRSKLLERFPPRYRDVRMDHITIDFPATAVPRDHTAHIEILGLADDGHGCEALLVSVYGQVFRTDGNPWHITISFDNSKDLPPELATTDTVEKYSAKISAQVIRNALNPEFRDYGMQRLATPIIIKADAKLLRAQNLNITPSTPETDSAPPPP